MMEYGMRTRNPLLARPEQTVPQPSINVPQYPQMNVPSIDGGMNTIVDPNDLQDNEQVLINNMVIRNGKMSRRLGVSEIGPTKPNADPVRKIFTLKQYDGTLVQLRITDDTIYRRGVTWVEITDAGGSPLTEGINNLVSTDDRHFFSTNGSTVIQEVNLLADTYAELGNAPRYKYITLFDNRIVGFNLVDVGGNNPIQVGWTGTFDYAEFDPLVNFEAGNAPLEETQSDYTDAGTGIFGFGANLLIVRERSIWLANKTGSFQQPFYFYTEVPSLGCDTPKSIQKIPGGIMYYDRRTRSMYVYQIGSKVPTPIGRQVEDDVYSSISNPDDIFSEFDSINLEYKLGVPQAGTDVTRIWTYSFKSNAWWYEDRDDVTSISNLDFGEPSLLIEELVGNIEDLLGNIEDLGEDDVPSAVTFFGKEDGEIEQEDVNVVTGYDSEVISKTWTAPQNNDFYVRRCTFTYDVTVSGSLSIYYSKDNGVTYTLFKTIDFSAMDIGKRLRVVCAKSVKCTQFSWKITSSEGIFSLIDFKALTEPSGYSV